MVFLFPGHHQSRTQRYRRNMELFLLLTYFPFSGAQTRCDINLANSGVTSSNINSKISAGIMACGGQFSQANGSLKLGNNQLTQLPATAFTSLTAIIKIELPQNLLTSLPSGIFNFNYALTELLMDNNPLASLPNLVFDKLTNLQTHLDMVNCKLTSLPDGVFKYQTRLQKISLSQNKLQSLPDSVFKYTTSLKTLSLNQNALTMLPPGVFDNLSKMGNSLNLHTNMLTNLRQNTFDKLTQLTATLDLSNNRFSELPMGIFDKLTRLDDPNIYGGSIFLHGVGVPGGGNVYCNNPSHTATAGGCRSIYGKAQNNGKLKVYYGTALVQTSGGNPSGYSDQGQYGYTVLSTPCHITAPHASIAPTGLPSVLQWGIDICGSVAAVTGRLYTPLIFVCLFAFFHFTVFAGGGKWDCLVNAFCV